MDQLTQLQIEVNGLQQKLDRVAEFIDVLDSMEGSPVDADLVAEDLRMAIADE